MKNRICFVLGFWLVPAALLVCVSPAPAKDFQIGTLSTGGCQVRDHRFVTGDDRGGIAVSSRYVLYTGDSGTGRFALADLGDAARFETRYDALAGNLRTGTVYTLGHGDIPINLPGGSVTTLLEVDPVSGRLTGDSILLSTLVRATTPTGIFSGFDRVVLHTESTVYDIELPSGKVRRLGILSLPGVQLCESWAFWGVAERFAGSVHLVYRQSPGSRIVRTRVKSGETTTLVELENLGDMCSFTVSPQTDRWYFEHEDFSQLGFSFEVLGFCDAVLAAGRRAHLSLDQTGPDVPVTAGIPFSYTFTVTNDGPASAAEVRFEDRLPGTLQLVSAASSRGSCAQSCETLVCELGKIRVGESATVTLDVLPLRGGRLGNFARAYGQRIDPDPADNEVAHDMVADPSTSVLFSVDRFSDELRALDATSGSTLASTRLTLPGATILRGEGLATHPVTGELWALLELAGSGRLVATVDPQSGEVRAIGAPGVNLSALAFDAAGTLYGVTRETLFILDATDATASPVLSLAADANLEGLAFNPEDGRLYLFAGSNIFRVVDPVDLAIADIPVENSADCSLQFSFGTGVDALTHLGGDVLFVADGLLRLQRLTTSGELSVAGHLDHLSGGLAWVDLPQADLSVTQTGDPDPVTVGNPLTYTVTVANAGPEPSTATLFDPVPGTASLVSATSSQGDCQPDSCGGLACLLGELDAGTSAEVTIEVTPWAEGMLAHAVSVPGVNDPQMADNESVVETLVTAAGSPAVLLSIDRFSDQLRTVDPMTGATLTSGSVTLPGETIAGGGGLAVHPLTGELWALLALAGPRQSARQLVTIDPAILVATLIGDTGDLFAALAFDTDGVLYGTTGSQASQPAALFVLSQADGTPTIVRSFAEPFTTSGQALAFSPVDGLLYDATNFFTQPRFASVDPATAELASIPVCGDRFDVPRALTHLGSDVLLFVDSSLELKSLTTGGVLKSLGRMDHVSKGLAFVTGLPPVDLSLSQTASPDRLPVGGRLTYTLTVRNEGAEAVPDVTLLDTLPGTVSLASATSSRGACATEVCGELACALGELGPGESAVVTIEVTPFAPGRVSNVARVSAFGDADPSDNRSEVETDVRSGSTRRKLLSLGRVRILSFESMVELHVVDPADGSTSSIIEVAVEGTMVEAGRGLATHPVTGELWALLQLEGQETSELVVLHPGSGTARRVGDTGGAFSDPAFDADGRLYATAPDGLFVLEQSDASASLALSFDEPGGALAFNPVDGLLYRVSSNLESVDPGDSTVTPIVACGDLPSLGAMTHGGGDTLLAVSSDDFYRLTTGGGLTSIGALDHQSNGLAWADLERGDLAVTQTAAPLPGTVGEELTYTLTVRNQGAGELSNVRFTDTLPSTVRLLSASPSQGACDVDACGALSCHLGDLGGGAETTVMVVVRPLAAGTVTNTVFLPALGDPDLSNNRTILETRIESGRGARSLLSVSESSNRLRVVDPTDGSTLASMTLTMAGETVTRAYGLSTHPETGELWALLGLLSSNDRELVTINAATGVARRVGMVEERFVSLAFDPDGILYAVTQDSPESLYIVSQTDARATPVLPFSDGGFAAEAIAFHQRTGQLYFAEGHFSGDSFAWRAVDLDTLASDELPVCRELDVLPGALAHLRGSTFLFATDSSRLYSLTTAGSVAFVGFMDHESSGLAFVKPLPSAEVSVTQSDAPDPVTAGTALTYTLDVRNDGPARVPGVTLFDPLPPTVSLVSASASRGSCRADLCGELVCDLGNLAPGAAATVTVETVPWAAGTVTNTASVPVFGDPVPDNNSSVEDTAVLPVSTRRLLLSVGFESLEVVDPIDASTRDSRPVTADGGRFGILLGLATHPLTGESWALASFFGSGYGLAVLDPRTGRLVRRIGDVGAGGDFTGLAFDAAGTLYALGTDDTSALYVLSQEDARATLVLAFEDRTFNHTIAFNPVDGLLYRAVGSLLQSIDPAGFAVTEIPICPVRSADPTALTHVGGDTLLLVNSDRLYTLTTGGVVKEIGYLGDSEGLAFVDVAFADLAVTQTSTPGPTAGETITYTVTVNNHGPDDVTDVLMTDALPATASLLSVAASQGACAFEACNGLVCALGLLASGTQATVTFEVATHVADTLINSVRLPALNDPDLENNQSVLETVVAPGASPAALLSLDPEGTLYAIDPGDGSTVGSISVVLPGADITGGRGLASHPVTGELWALLALHDRETAELARVDPVTGTAISLGDTGDRFVGLAFDAAGTLYGLTDRDALTPNSLFVLDPSDASASFVVSLSLANGQSLAFNPEDGLLYRAAGRLTLDAVDPATSAVVAATSCSDELFDDVAGLTHLGGGTLLLAARRSLYGLDIGGGASFIGVLEQPSRGLAFVNGPPSANLSVAQSDAPDPAAVGEALTYTLSVSNQGPDAVAGVTVFDTMPGTAGLVAAVPTQGTCGLRACGSLTCDLGELAGGQEVSVTVEVTPYLPGTVANTVFAPLLGDPDPEDNEAAEETTILSGSNTPALVSLDAQSAVLRVLDSSDGSTRASLPITLPGLPTRGGRGLALHPLTSRLWALLRSQDGFQSELVVLDPATGVAEHVGSVNEYFAGLAFDDGGTLYSLLSFGGGPVQLHVLSQTDASTTRVLTFGDDDEPFGQALAFDPRDGLLYVASGSVGLRSIDPVSGTVTEIASCTGASSGALTYLAGDVMLLAGGGELFGVTAGGGLAPLTALEPSSGGLALVDLAMADLAVTQTVTPGSIRVGGTLTYTSTVVNDGPDTVADVRLFDTLPATASLVAAVPSRGSCAVTPCAGLACSLGPLAAGESATVSVEVTALAAGRIANAVSVPAIGDPDPTDNDSVLEVTVLPGAESRQLISIWYDDLRVVDPTDGSTLFRHPIRVPGIPSSARGRGLAAHPVTGELWTVLELGEYNDTELVRIEPETGVGRRVGATGSEFHDLAFDAGGTLYGVNRVGELFVLDQEDASSTFIVDLDDRFNAEALAFNPVDGLFYHVSEGLTLQAVDPSGPSLTPIAVCGEVAGDLGALTHLGGETLLLASGDSLMTLTTQGGLASAAALDHSPDGLALVPELPSADVSVTQTAAPEPVAAGERLTYTVVVANDGPQALAAARLFDSLPGTVSVASVSASQGTCFAEACGSGLTCDLGGLAAGARATVEIEVTALLPGTLVHTVSVPVFADPEPGDNESVLETEVLPGAALPSLLSLDGSSGRLHVVDPASGERLTSQSLSVPGVSVVGGNGLAVHPLTGELWAVLRLSGQDGRELAIVDPTTGVARRVGNTGDRFAALAFDASGTLYGLTGGGASTPSSLFVLDQSDATPTLVGALTSGGGQALAFNPSNGLLYHAFGEIGFESVAPDTLATTTIATCGDLPVARALVHLDGGALLLAAGSRLYGLSAGGSVALIGSLGHKSKGLAFVDLQRADLAVTLSDSPDPAVAGSELTYTIAVANHGPDDADAVTVVDTLRGPLDLTAASPSQGACVTQACNGLVCDLGEVKAGEAATVTLAVTPLAGGTVASTAFAPNLGDFDDSDNQATEETLVVSAPGAVELLSLDGSSARLRIIDPGSGATLASQAIVVPGESVVGGNGLAAHPLTGELWALLRLEGQEGRELAVIEPASGVARRVGDTGDRFAALAFDDDGTLYGLTGRGASTPESLFVLDPNDATPALVTSLADEAGGEALAFNPRDGLLYHASGELGLESVDPTGLVRTPIAACDALPVARALTHFDGDTLLLAAGSTLYGVSVAGGVTEIGSLGNSKGLAFADVPTADLAVTQTTAPDPVVAGQSLTYTVTVANHGPDDVPGVTLSDTLPGTLDLISVTSSQGACTVEACGGLVCALGDLGAGEAVTVTIETTPLAAGNVVNRAVVPLLGDLSPDDNRSSLEVTVMPGASTATLLSIGANSGMLWIVDPGGGAPMGSIPITLEGAEIEGGNGLATHPSTGELWAVVRLAGRSGRELITLDPTTGIGRRVGDTGDRFAGLAFSTDGTLYGLTGRGAATPETLFVLDQEDATPSPVLSLADGRGGEAIAFNPADGLLYHVSGGLDFESVDLAGLEVTGIATCRDPPSDGTRALTHLGGQTFLLVDGNSRLYGITAAGRLASVGSLGHDSKGLAWFDLPVADLAVTQSDTPDPVATGEVLTYTVTVTNQGPDDVPGVFVSDDLPGTIDLFSVTPSQGTCETKICGGLACSLGAIEAGGAATVTVEARTLAAGTLSNSAKVTTLGDPDPGNDETVQETVVLPGATAVSLLSLDRSRSRIHLLDPTTGSTLVSRDVTLEGATVEGGNGLAAHPLTGELWAVLRLEGQNGRELVTLDPATGTATAVGNTGDNFAGLAFAADGTLYGLTGRGASTPESLFVLDQTDATPALVHSLADGMSGEALAFNPRDGLIYHGSGELALESFDPSDSTRMSIATCESLPTARALTYLDGDVLLLVAERTLYGLTTTGGVAVIGSLDHTSKGLAFVGEP